MVHCIYGVLWIYVTPLEYETVWLRLAGALSGFGLLMNKRWPAPLKRFLPWYWFLVVLYTLPFFATFQLLASNYSMLRSMVEVTMIFFVIIVFPQPVLAVTNMAIGMAASHSRWLPDDPKFRFAQSRHRQIDSSARPGVCARCWVDLAAAAISKGCWLRKRPRR